MLIINSENAELLEGCGFNSYMDTLYIFYKCLKLTSLKQLAPGERICFLFLAKVSLRLPSIREHAYYWARSNSFCEQGVHLVRGYLLRLLLTLSPSATGVFRGFWQALLFETFYVRRPI